MDFRAHRGSKKDHCLKNIKLICLTAYTTKHRYRLICGENQAGGFNSFIMVLAWAGTKSPHCGGNFGPLKPNSVMGFLRDLQLF